MKVKTKKKSYQIELAQELNHPLYAQVDAISILLTRLQDVKCGRKVISFATWNVKTLVKKGNLYESTHKLERYSGHVVRLCKVRWRMY